MSNNFIFKCNLFSFKECKYSIVHKFVYHQTSTKIKVKMFIMGKVNLYC